MWQAFLKSALVLTFSFLITSTALASQELINLRSIYSIWRNASNQLPKQEQLALLRQLKNYPLSLYAEYNYLVNQISTIDSKQITQFTHHYSDSPLADDLKRLYISTLYKQKKWSQLVSVPRDKSVQSQCYYYHSLYNKTKDNHVLQPLNNIWLSGKYLPAACDHAFAAWKKAGNRTANLILLRIELAIKAKNINLATQLAKQLPDNYKTTQIALLDLLKNPKKLTDFSDTIAYSGFSKKIVLLSFPRLARQNPEYALRVLPLLTVKQQLSTAEQNKLKRTIAMQFFCSKATEAQIKWRDDAIASIGSVTLIERRIRQALRENNDQDVSHWLNLIPKKAKNKDEWLYLEAVMLGKQNQQTTAKNQFDALSKRRGFYAMLSSQKLGKEYNYNLNYSIVNGESNKKAQKLLLSRYNKHVVIRRIKELLHWQNDRAARREWHFLISLPENESKLAELARFAHLQGWAPYSIQATIKGKLWDNWIERFPPAYIDLFKQALNGKEIPLSYSLAISRQESALQPRVVSRAGARGLMQVMPATAKDMAKKIDGFRYSSADQLYEPETNILLGTHFLELVYQQFDKNRILSSIAYNAGPNRVARWLKQSNSKLDVAAFIETIPFAETRNYVKSILVYDYIYQIVLKGKPTRLILEKEMNRRY